MPLEVGYHTVVLVTGSGDGGLHFSGVICWRQLKQATQMVTKTLATALAVTSETGSASDQWVYLSMTMRQYQDTDAHATA